MFLSGTMRNPYQDSKVVTDVVQYDNQTNTIIDGVKKKGEVGAGNPLLANLQAKRGLNAGFNCNAPRF